MKRHQLINECTSVPFCVSPAVRFCFLMRLEIVCNILPVVTKIEVFWLPVGVLDSRR